MASRPGFCAWPLLAPAGSDYSSEDDIVGGDSRGGGGEGGCEGNMF